MALDCLMPTATLQDHDLFNIGFQACRERLQVLTAFGQHEWRSTFADAPKNIFANHFVAVAVGDQLAIEILKLDSLIGIGFQLPDEILWAARSRNVETAGRLLGLGIDTMSHWPTLHENDRVMPVFASHRCG